MKKEILERVAKKRKNIATIRYILPFAVCMLMLILFLLPLIYFRDYNNTLTESSSLFLRMSENFAQARLTLFSGKSGVDAAYVAFSQFIMIGVSVGFICFALGLFSSLMYMITGLAYLNGDRSKKLRRIFVTFVPNKITVITLSALCACPSLFPHFLVKSLDRVMMIYSKAHFVAGDLLIWCVILLLIPTVFFIATKKHDTDEVNIFAKRKGQQLQQKED